MVVVTVKTRILSRVRKSFADAGMRLFRVLCKSMFRRHNHLLLCTGMREMWEIHDEHDENEQNCANI